MTPAQIHPCKGRDRVLRVHRIRATAAIATVLLAHALGIAWELSSRTVTLDSASGATSGKSISVSLVSAPAPQPVAAAPVPQPEREPTQPPPKKPQPVVRKAPEVVTAAAPSTRTVQKAEDNEKPLPQVSPSQTPQPVAAARPVAVTQPASAQAANEQTSDTNALALPKVLGADGLHQLGCRIPQPVYPAKAKRLEQTGTVLVRVTIGLDGRVTDATVARSSGSDLLDVAALDAIRAGSCKLYVENGHPRLVQATQPIAFSLDD